MAGSKVKWNELQEYFAAGSPILAIGPGCHRIGYEEVEEWQRVIKRARAIWQGLEQMVSAEEADRERLTKARRRFLERFWEAQLHEPPVKANGNGQSTSGPLRFPPTIANQPAQVGPADKAQIVLATHLLCGLISLTRLLGSTIRAGAAPVTDWDRFGARMEEDGGVGRQSTDRTASRRFLSEAIYLLGDAQSLAAELCVVEESSRDRGDEMATPPTMKRLGLNAEDACQEKLQLLKASAISSGLQDLIDKRLKVGAEQVSGAVVEWLSDLFWHVVVSGAGVPPSQSELSFYLNLHELKYTKRRFSRPHPGEYRSSLDGDENKTDADILREDLSALLGDYDSGKDGRERNWTRPRESFALTMAASLVESWRDEEGKRLAVALLSDYDLMFERAALELLRRGESLHVIVPTVPDKPEGDASFVWLFGTYEHGLDGDGGELPEPTWERFDAKPKGFDKTMGPLVIRLTGCPLFKLGSLAELGLRTQFHPAVTHLEPAAIFSEHDSVQAIMDLTPPLSAGVTSEQLFLDDLLGPRGLTWDKRSWLFFGHRFSDWLPRLQLLFTALMLAAGRTSGEKKKQQQGAWEGKGEPRTVNRRKRIAISRDFDWPEQALLDALKVGMRCEDLTQISTYFSRGPLASKEEVQLFLDKVEKAQASLRQGSVVA